MNIEVKNCMGFSPRISVIISLGSQTLSCENLNEKESKEIAKALKDAAKKIEDRFKKSGI